MKKVLGVPGLLYFWLAKRSAATVAWLIKFWLVMSMVSCAQHAANTQTVAGNESLAAWQALLRDDPYHPDSHYRLAEEYGKRYHTTHAKKDKQQAIYHARQALIARPDDFAAQSLLYGIYYNALRMGDTADSAAINAIYRGIAPPLRRNLFPPSLALYLRQLDAPVKDVSLERKLLLRAIGEQPQNGVLHAQLSRYFFAQDAVDLAFASLLQAQRLEPENPDILMALGDAYKSRAYHFDCVYDRLDDIKRSAAFYKQVLTKKPDIAEAHFGLMVDYGHLGLAPLSLREGDLWLAQSPDMANRWSLAIFNAYLGQPAKADELFKAYLASDTGVIPSRGHIEHLMIKAEWAEAAKIFPRYIQSVKQPGVADLLSAAIIRAELDNDKITLEDLWQTDKKAVYFSAWDESLVKFWRSEIDEAALKAVVKDSCNAADFEFYAGYYKLLHNRVGEAKVHFEKARRFAQPLNFERRLAETLLSNL